MTHETDSDLLPSVVEHWALFRRGCGPMLVRAAVMSLLMTGSDALAANDKLGMVGAFNSASALPYTIRFENFASSAGPAQQVVVSDPLDLATLDPQTFSLDAITFGRIRIVPPPGLRSYATQVDLRPAQNLLVNVSAAVDMFTGVASWYFSSIDPATGQPPTDPLMGFLPPNVSPPEGEGSVLFTVQSRPGLPSGTVISNGGFIALDDAPVIATNVWQNTFDNTPPSSHVLPLANFSDQSTILVQWTAEGPAADLRDFSVYVSEDGAAYRSWRLNTAATADTLVPPTNHQVHEYSFYSVARDTVGNVEEPPAVPDATTFARTAVVQPGAFVISLDGALPNPSVGAMNVRFTLPSSETAILEVIDISGRRILRREVGHLGPGRHGESLAASPPLPPGIYTLRLVQGHTALSARAAVIE